MPEINGIRVPFLPPNNDQQKRLQSHQHADNHLQRFAEILEQTQKKLYFSSHAQTRLKSRNITLSPEQMEKLQNAVTLAESKGSRQTVVIMGNKAFVISVENRTVITALESGQMTERIVTNIDSAVFLNETEGTDA